MRKFGPFFLILALFFLVSRSDLCHAEKLPLSIDYEVAGVSYVDSVPKPESVIGHVIGTRHSSPAQIVSYFQAVAATSERVVVNRHGSTYESRPQIHAVVTSAENHLRLEQLRQDNLRLSDVPNQLDDNQLQGMPAVVIMGYSVHGNEASGSEAAMLLLYHLSAGRGLPVESVLDQTIVIIDPMLNPDGRNRFVTWVNGNRGRVPTADPQDREHREPWPGGRVNHYWFDLNRDWLPAQLRETQGRLQLYHHWRPQVMTDFHEMGSDATYFFQPGVPSRTNPLTPGKTSELTAQIAAFHARALDSIGSLYYSEETFDDFYYGKGSTYPDLNGGVGILFEQAHSRAIQRETRTGILHYDFTIRNQAATSLSTLRAVVELREQLLRNQVDFYLASSQLAAENPVKAYVFNKHRDGNRGLTLIEILLRHRIQVYDLKEDQEIEGIRFQSREAVVVPTLQPQTRLVRTIMEEVKEFEDTSFYDVSAWTLPPALGITIRELRETLPDLLGDEIKEVPAAEGELIGDRSDYAYLMEWGDFFTPRGLFQLQTAGISTRVLVEPTEHLLNGQSRRFDQGTIVIPVMQQGIPVEGLHESIERAVQEEGVRVFATSTGLTGKGPDLGGPSSRVLEMPRVLLLSGPGTNRNQIGEIWFLLNEQMGIPISLVDVKNLENLELHRYNTLIVPGGSYKLLSEETLERLRKWIRSGGLLIAIQDAVRWTIEQKLVEETLREKKIKPSPVPYAEVKRARNAQEISGAIFQVSLDRTHPITFGYRATGAVFRTHTIVIEPSKSPGANVALYGDDPHISGYVSKENLERLKGGASIIARKVGSGAIVLFVENPNFRAFWHGSSTLFLNTIFFGRSL